MKNKFLLGIGGSVLLLAVALVLFGISKSRTFQFFGRITHRVQTGEKIVALTFDDAPTEHTEEVLKILRDKQVKITAYVIGENVDRYPDAMRMLVRDGHEIGNHSFSHQRFLLKSPAFIDAEIRKTDERIRWIGYTGPITFRPPNGKKLFLLPWYLSKHDRETVTWDVEPDTYVPKSATGPQKTQFIVSYVLEHTVPGSIILIHPLCASCGSERDALLPVIDALHAQGYRFVTVSDLLSRKSDSR